MRPPASNGTQTAGILGKLHVFSVNRQSEFTTIYCPWYHSLSKECRGMKWERRFVVGPKFNAKLSGLPGQLRKFNRSFFPLLNPRFRHCHHKIPPLDPFPSLFNTAHVFLPSSERASNYSVFTNASVLAVCICCLPHANCKLWLYYFLWFYSLSNRWNYMAIAWKVPKVISVHNSSV
jgi:hypothetical protein